MNEHDDPNELPELTDEDVELLYDICKRASELNEPPYAALFAAYDSVFADQQINQNHDGVVFRYLMRVGETTRAANKERRPVDLVERLRSVLDALGITVLDPQDNEPEDFRDVAEERQVTPRKPYRSPNRRVSFDDARLEETWLSEHSQPVNPPLPIAPRSLLSLPPRRGRHVGSERRARSTSSKRNHLVRYEALKDSHHGPPSTAEPSESDDQLNPTLLFEPSQTQLEQNAEAFFSTSALRTTRQVLHTWHDATLRLQQSRSQAYTTALAQDHRTLLKQALDQWRSAFLVCLQERRNERLLQRYDENVTRIRRTMLVRRAFTHWAMCCEHEKLKTKVAQRHILKVTYFKRWKAIASENQMKVRSVLVRKYISVWREKTARKLLSEEQAVAYYEEGLMRKYKKKWFWQFCSRRVEGWHEQWIQRRVLTSFANVLDTRRARETQANVVYHSRLERKTFQTLIDRLRHRRDCVAIAQQHHDRETLSRSLQGIRIQNKLIPLARTLVKTINANLQSKSLRVWRLHFGLSQQAAEVDRKCILQTAWTNWNDTLRCTALAQKIDERVLVENLYRWVLQQRLKLSQRTIDGRLLSRALRWWRNKVEEERDRLAEAEIVFVERQRRRRLAYGMLRLNIEMRKREDGERAALEWTNSRGLPKVIDAWKGKTNHARRLVKMAIDARFYCLCTSTLRIWQERTTEHKASRRREAYVQVRASVKIRLVKRCLVKWRTAGMEVHSMGLEAERRAQSRVSAVGARAFMQWREQSNQYAELKVQALEMDQQKLLSSALGAIGVKQADLAAMVQQALDFKRESDLALLASALRRVQWATFTAVRKVESADALWARNRDQHVKQMLRHWAALTADRRAAATQGQGPSETQQEEPESPSLRPASRAASRSAMALDAAPPSSPPLLASTPGYMRTPSRPRRAGRFRPLPTPAPFTPMAFESGLLATTPAPIPGFPPPDSQQQTYESLTPQVTPFSRKLRAGGFPSTLPPASALRNTVIRGTAQDNIAKSVRFAGGSRFGYNGDRHAKDS